MSGEQTSVVAAPAVAGPLQQRAGVDPVPAADGTATWTEYVAAARQLDGVRRSAATAATEQARAVQAAREELTGVRERLAAQRSRLRELGVPTIVLAPSPPELSEAAREMVCGPSAVLTALRAARGWADGADGLLAARGRLAPAAWPPRLRNLLVYGPIALVVPLLQVVLYVTTGTGPASVFALLCGLPMPAVAFVAGWIGVGRIFGRPPEPAHAAAPNPAVGDPDVAAGGGTGAVPPVGPGGMPASGVRLDRTARWGALVCLVPAVLTTAGIVLAMLAG
ncbi:hypothetical protein [Micromonospora sp. KC207]|uniref:hypothetical protein n=1 Tax=Micromonospora sp. KC207 TaxID=2530377 RepID=UPI001FB5E425|nr:hypothetical protein [Micromonospora sp. KC207]